MEEAAGSAQEEAISRIKRGSLEEGESPSAREEDQSRHCGDEAMEPRMGKERPMSPSYLSMKSNRSKDEPINFTSGDSTQEGTQISMVDPARSESPTSTYSAMSDSSIERPIHFKLCDICFEDLKIKIRAVKTCQNCTSSFCEKHIRDHYTKERFQTHHIVDVPGGLEPCQDHHKPLEVFCLTDQRFICSQCSATKHKGHSIHHQTQQGVTKHSAGMEAQRPCSINVLPSPGEIRFLSVKSDSVSLSWEPPKGLEGPRKFRVTWEDDGVQNSLLVTNVDSVKITGLQPGQKYDFSVATQGDHGNHSKCISKSIYTVVPPPSNMKVYQLGPSSFKVCWSRSPVIEKRPQQFLVNYTCPRGNSVAIHAKDCSTKLTDLQPGTQYTVEVRTVLYNEQQSEPVNTTICTSIPAPNKLTVVSVDTTSATVIWEQPDGMELTQLQYHVSISPETRESIPTISGCSIKLNGLQPGWQ